MKHDARRLHQALLDYEAGICLWMGAGVTKHVALDIGGAVPDWNEVTVQLETMAGVGAKTTGSLSNPQRLQVCRQKLGASVFRRAISQRIYGQLCKALANFAHRSRGRLANAPQSALQLAALGWLANPIVNFNVETLTSYLVARPGGACRILPYRIRDATGSPGDRSQECSSDFFRTVYHPHGAVDYSGHAVMTSREYDAFDGSLGSRLNQIKASRPA